MNTLSAYNFVYNFKKYNHPYKANEKWGQRVYFSSKDVPKVESSWIKLAWTKFNGGKQFHGFSSLYNFTSFMNGVPKLDRHFEEVLEEDRVQKFHMDIECDYFENIDDIDEYFEFLTEYYEKHFLNHLLTFFRHHYNFPVSLNNFKISYAIKKRAKWSSHLVLSNLTCFESRKDLTVCALALAKYLDEIDDPLFNKWYIGNDNKHIIDYNIYSIGKRNMRLLGSCKRLKRGQGRKTWIEMRPLLPMQSQKNDSFLDYLITVNEDLSKYNKLKLDSKYFSALSTWYINQIKNSDVPVKLQQAYAIINPRNSLYSNNSFSLNRQISDSTALPSRILRDKRRIHMAELLKNIDKLDNYEYVLGNDTSIRQEKFKANKELKLKFYKIAEHLAITMANYLHPGQRIMSNQNVDPSMGEVVKIGVDTFVNNENGLRMLRTKESGEIVDQRMCYWSFDQNDNSDSPCQSGQHQAKITVMADYSVEYFCHGCKKKGIAVYPPIKSSRIRPIIHNKGAPLGYEGKNPNQDEIYIDYGKTLSDRENRFFMQDIKSLPSGKLYDPSIQRTIILRGGMGAGKSTVCKAFLTKVRQEIKENEKRDARILSISFRQMLARSSAKSFNLERYNDKELGHWLIGISNIACQLDSVKRLGEISEIGEIEYKPYDIMILDESESILSHLSSKTMKESRNEVFDLLKHLTKLSKIVIFADADMSRRSHYYIKATRSINNSSHFTEYHRNPFLRKDLFYIDYKYVSVWFNRLCEAVTGKDRKRVFIVSNTKAMLHNLKALLLNFLDKQVKKYKAKLNYSGLNNSELKTLDFLSNLQSDENFIKIIDADVSGSEKANMAENCNTEWTRFRILGISPVVGAGISFDITDYFNEAYIFATPCSCNPRSINQLLGRVRHLTENRVRLYIKPRQRGGDIEKSEDEIFQDLINDGRTSSKRARLNIETRTILPDGTLRYNLHREDKDLLRILAMNEREVIKGQLDFRKEFIRVLQENNPSVNYSFDTSGSENEFDISHNLMIDSDSVQMKKKESNLLKQSAQPELDELTLKEVKMKNDRGELVFEDNELQQEEITPLIKKNQIKTIIGIEDSTDDEVYETYSKLIELCGDLEKIKNFATILFTSRNELKKSQENIYDKMEYSINGNKFKLASKANGGIDIADQEIKFYTYKLLFIGGFEKFDTWDLQQTEPEIEGLAYLKGHDKIMKERINNEEIQEWMHENLPSMCRRLQLRISQIGIKADKLKTVNSRLQKTTDFSARDTTENIKKFFFNIYGITLEKKGENKKQNLCNDCGSKCFILKPATTFYRLQLALSREYLCTTVTSENSWIKEAYKNIDDVCKKLDIGRLPSTVAFDNTIPLELELEKLNDYINLMYQKDIEKFKAKRLNNNKKNKKKKRNQQQQSDINEIDEKDSEEKFDDEWKNILELNIGKNLYEETDPETYLGYLLSEGYKFRTKKEMEEAKLKMIELKKKLNSYN